MRAPLSLSLSLSINQWRHDGDTLFPGREKILIFLGQRCFFIGPAAKKQGLLLETCRTKPLFETMENEYYEPIPRGEEDEKDRAKLKRIFFPNLNII